MILQFKRGIASDGCFVVTMPYLWLLMCYML